MKKLLTIVALMILSFASKAQLSSITFTQNVEAAPGNFSFALFGHDTPPPACAVTNMTTAYGALFGIPSTVFAAGAAWVGPVSLWISRIEMYNVRTTGNFNQPFCAITPGTYPITFSDGTSYNITFAFTGPTSLNVTLNP